jgi:hypothetical protein
MMMTKKKKNVVWMCGWLYGGVVGSSKVWWVAWRWGQHIIITPTLFLPPPIFPPSLSFPPPPSLHHTEEEKKKRRKEKKKKKEEKCRKKN